jgi:hypothetical protein
MGLLARVLSPSGLTIGRPPVPFYRVHETWYPWYQTSSAAPECLASELKSQSTRSSYFGEVVECFVQLGITC